MEIILVEDDDTPEYPNPAEVGASVLVTGTLCTNNSVGGTEVLKHSGTQCTVTKAFWDYETGWRYHGRVEDAASIEEFRKQSTSEFTPEYYREKHPENPSLYERVLKASERFDPGYVYFSEHDFEKRV